MLRDQQVLEHGHAGEQADVLEGAGDLGAVGDAMARQVLQRVDLAADALQAEGAGGGSVEAGDAVEQGGLAGAVGADDGGDASGGGGEIQRGDRGEAAEAHGQSADLEKVGQPADLE